MLKSIRRILFCAALMAGFVSMTMGTARADDQDYTAYWQQQTGQTYQQDYTAYWQNIQAQQSPQQ